MLLVDQLDKDTIVVPINAQDSSSVVQELLNTLLKLNHLTATVKLFSFINKEENQMNSAVGRGVAYTHAVSMEVSNLVCVLGISKDGVEFPSTDGQPSNIVLLSLTPKDNPNAHWKFIRRFQSMISDVNIKEKLINSIGSKEAGNLIQDWEDQQEVEEI